MAWALHGASCDQWPRRPVLMTAAGPVARQQKDNKLTQTALVITIIATNIYIYRHINTHTYIYIYIHMPIGCHLIVLALACVGICILLDHRPGPPILHSFCPAPWPSSSLPRVPGIPLENPLHPSHLSHVLIISQRPSQAVAMSRDVKGDV